MSAYRTVQTSHELWDMSPAEVVEAYSPLAHEAFSNLETATPVIICALNEAEDIPATLAGLALSDTEVLPVVVDNGSSDKTLEVAQAMGAKTIEEPMRNKLRAFQRGIRYTRGTLERLDPILFTDADTIVSSSWARKMLKMVRRHDQGSGGLLAGQVVFSGGPSPMTNRLRTTSDIIKQINSKVRGAPVKVRGANMAIWFDETGRIEKGLQDLEAPFPQDVAISDQVALYGGIVKGILSVDATVVSKGDRYSNFKEYLATRRPDTGLSSVDLYRLEYGDDHPAYTKSN